MITSTIQSFKTYLENIFNDNPKKIILVLALGFLIYQNFAIDRRLDTFVPYNAYEAPDPTLNQTQWSKVNDKFGQLIQTVNGMTYSVAYDLENISKSFADILNNSDIGKFNILSIGDTQQFTLLDVIVQEVSTLAVMKFSRVDFIVESLNPFKIQKVNITPDKTFQQTQGITARDLLKSEEFRIINPLHLFSPYQTSDDEMKITLSDQSLFDKELIDKAKALQDLQDLKSEDALVKCRAGCTKK